MPRTRLIVILAIALLGCDHDYGFQMTLISPAVPDPMKPVIPANEVATLSVESTRLNSHTDLDDTVCVDITVSTGRLSCPGFSCFTAGGLDDGGILPGASHVFLNVPVGNGPHTTFPIYHSPMAAGTDVITGDAYVTDCQTLVASGGRFSGTSYLQIEVIGAADMAVAPSDATDMGAEGD
jgi:hypothetical protein